MAKKHKNSNSGSGSGSGSGAFYILKMIILSFNVFRNIFGVVPEQQSSVSTNPSDHSQTPQQPPQQLGLGVGSAEDVENTTNGEYENHNFLEVKKRKRRDQKPNLDSVAIDEVSETPLEIKKLKKDEPKTFDLKESSRRRGKGKGKKHKESSRRGKGKKHTLGDPNLGFASDMGTVLNGTVNLESLEANGMEKKKKQRKRDELEADSVVMDEVSETPLEIKKLKKDEPKTFGLKESSRRGKGKKHKESSRRGKGKKHTLGPESKEDPNLGFELNIGEVSNGTVNLESLEANKMEKKKKKRKRDELEAEYCEAQRYGVVETNDEGGKGGKVGEKRKKIIDPVDMMVSKEGFEDEAKLLRTVFVGNLPLKVKKKALFKEFSQFGEIESVSIRSVPILDSKQLRKGAIIQKKINDAVESVHAYIIFETEQAAQASLAHNMAAVGGNHIRVDRACPPCKKLKGENTLLYDNMRTVFVGNIPFDVKDEEIYQLFSGIKDLESSIEGIRVIRDPGTSMRKGIAYVLFQTRVAANLVVKKRSLKLRDREVRLYRSMSNLAPSKRENPSSLRESDDSRTKKLAVDSRTLDSSNKVNTKVASSYQGLRASKSGVL